MNRNRALLIAASLAVPTAAAGQVTVDPGDVTTILNAALYPVQFMSTCYRGVDQNRDFQTAGIDWYVRNGDILDMVAALAPAAGVTDASRLEAERDGLAEIQIELDRVTDQKLYCQLIAKSIDYGGFDLEVRADILPVLKRVLPQRYAPRPSPNP